MTFRWMKYTYIFEYSVHKFTLLPTERECFDFSSKKILFFTLHVSFNVFLI